MPELRAAFRTAVRTPALTIAAVTTLALGIGTTLAVAAIVYGVLLRPLPVHDESRLVVAYATRPAMQDFSDPISHPQFLDWKASGVFDDLAVTRSRHFDITGASAAERVDAETVSTNFFDVIGARAALGRLLTSDDADAVDIPAVISDAFWRRQFAADRAVLGRTLRTVDRTFIIVGVMPPAFDRWRGPADVWVPLDRLVEPEVRAGRGYLVFNGIGRLPQDVTRDAAEARLATVQQELGAARGRRRRNPDGVRLVTLRDDIVGATPARIVMMLGAVAGLVWLVVCANVANLLMASVARRRGELSVRAAIGAGRARLMRQLLTETALLAAAGTAGGWFVAHVAVAALSAYAPSGELDMSGVVLDWRVALFGGLLGAATAMLCGLVPAWRASRAAFEAGVAVGRTTADRRLTRATGLLMSGEIAVAMVVLIGAALLAQTLIKLSRVELGFDPGGVYSVPVSLNNERYGAVFTPASRHAEAYQELTDRLRRLRGVERVSLGGPFLRGDDRTSIDFDDGRRLMNGRPADRLVAPRAHMVGADYFQLMHIPVREGRGFTEEEAGSARRVAVVNETMARLHWPGGSPIGRRLNFGTPRGEIDPNGWTEIIGVMADARYGSLDAPMKPELYRPIFQRPYYEALFLIRTSDGRTPQGVMEVLKSFDPTMPVFPIESLEDEIAESTAAVRYSALLLSCLAGFAVLLALVGLYALLANDVAARGRELAIRLAVGAEPALLVRIVLRRATCVLVPGLAVGIVAAWIMGGALESLLFETPPVSATAFGVSGLLIVSGALLAVCRPAHRASRIDPVVLLRAD
ncbi:MAG: ABC transporter permease [Vicinamibacterales bacterium]